MDGKAWDPAEFLREHKQKKEERGPVDTLTAPVKQYNGHEVDLPRRALPQAPFVYIVGPNGFPGGGFIGSFGFGFGDGSGRG